MRLILFFLLLIPSPASAQIDHAWDVIPEKEYHKSAVGVRTDLPGLLDYMEPRGTGVIVKVTDEIIEGNVDGVPDGKVYRVGYVLTCWHVVVYDNGEDRLVIGFRNGEQVRGSIVKWDYHNDWALVKTMIPDGYVAAEFADDYPVPGDELECVGLGGGVKADSTRVRRFKVIAGRTTHPGLIRVDEVVVQGDSGGPVFKDGKLVGLISAGRHFCEAPDIDGAKAIWGGIFVGLACFEECLND